MLLTELIDAALLAIADEQLVRADVMLEAALRHPDADSDLLNLAREALGDSLLELAEGHLQQALRDHRVAAGEPVLMAAQRDHSLYTRSRGGQGFKMYVIASGGSVSRCGRPTNDNATQPASEVPARQRCQRPGCKEQWPGPPEAQRSSPDIGREGTGR